MTKKTFSGSRVLVAIAVGLAIGSAIAYFLKVLIENTPAEIDLHRMRLFYLMVITSSGLAGFAIETTRQLQEEAVDPVYRHPNAHRGRRGSQQK
ncbi:hypothetical protein N9S87_01835 [Synechococcus sp. AH-779-G23]|nr:hypothetical protein [Synechococcus sp. AH-779-G23]MDA9639204.1 hypothetical protein [Synechococcus sp. AH-779-G23]